jgi:hypothetical protein
VSRNITFNTIPVILTEDDGDVIIAKFNPDGVLEWTNALGRDPVPGGYERYNCWPTAIKTSAGGDSYIYGWTGSANYYGSFLLESPYNYNFFVTKVNKSGTVQWARIIKEKKYGYHSMQCDLDKTGNFYLGGNFYDTLYFDNQVVLPQGERDLFFAKYDLNGNIAWVKLFNSNPLAHSAWYNPVNYLNAITVYDSESVFIGGGSTYDMQFGTGVLHISNLNGFVALLGQDIPYGIDPSPDHPAGLTVYPNPAKDLIFLDVSGIGPGRISINILNVQGESIRQLVLESSPQVVPVDLAGVVPGVYIVKLTNAGSASAAKFVVR